MPYLLTRTRSRDFCARVQIPASPAVIGRGRTAAIRLEDRSVSKIHASIEPVPGTLRFLIRDLGSRNGILVKGTRHEEITLGVGDEFALGQVRVTICGEGPPTLTVPDLTERPVTPAVPRNAAHQKALSSWRTLLDSSERSLIVALTIVLGGLITSLLLIPWDRA